MVVFRFHANTCLFCLHAARRSQATGSAKESQERIHRLQQQFPDFETQFVADNFADSAFLLCNIGLEDQQCAERFAQERLLAMAKSRTTKELQKPAVLFLCGHNAGRSQMAAAWARHLGGDDIIVFSGGSGPADKVNPMAVKAMEQVGIDIKDQFPKPVTREIAMASDIVISMGCGDSICNTVPGLQDRQRDWELADPHGQGLDMVEQVRDQIKGKVEQLLVQLREPQVSA